VTAWWTEHSREEMAASDPYGGRGVFLAAPGVAGDEMITLLAARMGAVVPAVAWDGIGAWVDPGSTGTDPDLIRERWDGGKASGHW
jgi:hypothetical protein